MNQTARIETLKKRPDFLRLNEGSRKYSTSCFLLVTKPHSLAPDLVRVGYTVTKKMGGAVQRNRIKRRLRAAVREVFPTHAMPGHDYILIARQKSLNAPFHELTEHLRFALSHLHKARPHHNDHRC